MAEFDLATVMDAIANQLKSANVTKRAYGFPDPDVKPPCAIVGYPQSIDFDMTFGRGADTLEFPIWFLVGKVIEKSARNNLSKIITGTTGIKAALDGNLGGAISSGRVMNVAVDTFVSGDETEYLAAKFLYQVIR